MDEGFETKKIIKKTKKTTKKVIIEDGDVKENVTTTEYDDGSGDQLIFSGEYAKGMEGKDFHEPHFNCWQCDENLLGSQYIQRDDHPFCIKCFESGYTSICEGCSQNIGVNYKVGHRDICYKDKHWHEDCFCCSKCGGSLIDSPFGTKSERIFCQNCYDDQFGTRCDGCAKPFKSGEKKIEYKGKTWHEDCFVCVTCLKVIGNNAFIPRGNEIFCANCFEDKHITKCAKCSESIGQDGITWRDEPWHNECFSCANCNKLMAGEKFVLKDEQIFCTDCFLLTNSKTCAACNGKISGVGGTQFVVFEDKNWHKQCFTCNNCKSELAGKGFISDENEIICSECAKSRMLI